MIIMVIIKRKIEDKTSWQRYDGRAAWKMICNDLRRVLISLLFLVELSSPVLVSFVVKREFGGERSETFLSASIEI